MSELELFIPFGFHKAFRTPMSNELVKNEVVTTYNKSVQTTSLSGRFRVERHLMLGVVFNAFGFSVKFTTSVLLNCTLHVVPQKTFYFFPRLSCFAYVWRVEHLHCTLQCLHLN